MQRGDDRATATRRMEEAMGKGWIRVAVLDDVPEGSTRLVEVNGHPVCLYNLAGTICATQDTCPHAEASLADGFIDGDVIECPLHQATFDIRTGKVMTPPATGDLRVYPVQIENDEISVLAGE
jgi:nitrite reductase/ring-hydroxylating ferredoxin subunit